MGNEKTSAKVATKAAKILSNPKSSASAKSVAASALTQVEDHAERETLRRGKLPRGHKLVKRHKPVVRNGRCGSDGPWTD